MKRRTVLSVAGLSALGLSGLGGLALPGTGGQTGRQLRSRAALPAPYTVPLPVPPVARPVRSDATTDYYEIVQRAVDAEILPGLRTPILGYDGRYPGPTLVTRSGRRTVVTHRNELSVPVAVHLHGGHTPADSDGYPTDLVLPVNGWSGSSHVEHGGVVANGQRDYVYPLDQRAATLWYHDHRMDFTGQQVYRGLAGFHLVTDDEDAALPLPRGERDLPLMIADRSFGADGAFDYPAAPDGRPGVTDEYMGGVLGDVILVNGAPWPVHEVDAARYRLRLLNGSNARRYQLRFDPAVPVVQIGSDGGLLSRPVEQESVVLSPGERFEVVADFSGLAPGTAVTVRNELGSGSTADVMRFQVARKAADDSRIPDVLSRVEQLSAAAAVRTRTWKIRRAVTGGHPAWQINDVGFDPQRVDAIPRLGETEIWRFTSDAHHPMHVHLSPFQVLSRRDGDPGQFDAGWKDTVDLVPFEPVDVLVRFDGYAGKYLVHCHNLEHEDMAMMSVFQTW